MLKIQFPNNLDTTTQKDLLFAFSEDLKQFVVLIVVDIPAQKNQEWITSYILNSAVLRPEMLKPFLRVRLHSCGFLKGIATNLFFFFFHEIALISFPEDFWTKIKVETQRKSFYENSMSGVQFFSLFVLVLFVVSIEFRIWIFVQSHDHTWVNSVITPLLYLINCIQPFVVFLASFPFPGLYLAFCLLVLCSSFFFLI